MIELDAPTGTFADLLEGRNNALSGVRLLLAVLVIVSHASPLGGFGQSPHLHDLSLRLFTVGGFFAISGFVVTRSRLRTGFARFAWRRFLRIVPAYWVAMAVTGFGIAGLVGIFRGGWSSAAASEYVGNGLFLRTTSPLIGTTLDGTPYPLSWNGSLWTLQWEVLCYLAVAVAACIGFIRRSRWLIPLAFIAASALSTIVGIRGILGPKNELLLVLPYFLAGAMMYLYSDRIPVTWRWAAGSFGCLLTVGLLNQGRALAPLFVAYLCLWLGAKGPAWARRVGATNDFSYGMFLYGFPVQQALAAFGVVAVGVVGYSFVSVLATIPFAVASWFLVEKPVQRLRRLTFSRRRATAP